MCSLIPRFYEVTEGNIYLDEIPIQNLTLSSLRKNIGIVQQDIFLFPDTIMENIRYGKLEASDEEVIEAAKKAELHPEILQMEHGYETCIGERGVRLSGGQKQRVAIAGVVAMRPSCIVLDEPTAMLDPNGRKEVIRAVRALNQVEKVTAILITHYMEEVIYADKVIVMDDGKIVMQGTPFEIFAQVDTLKKYRLDVPQVTLLAHELRKAGVDLPECVLSTEELVKALCQ